MDCETINKFMKVDNIFTKPQEPNDEEELLLDLSSDFGFDDFDDLMFNPVHVRIHDDAMVSLVKDGAVLQHDKWENIIDWINENWNTLTGRYMVAERGMVIHEFTIAH